MYILLQDSYNNELVKRIKLVEDVVYVVHKGKFARAAAAATTLGVASIKL